VSGAPRWMAGTRGDTVLPTWSMGAPTGVVARDTGSFAGCVVGGELGAAAIDAEGFPVAARERPGCAGSTTGLATWTAAGEAAEAVATSRFPLAVWLAGTAAGADDVAVEVVETSGDPTALEGHGLALSKTSMIGPGAHGVVFSVAVLPASTGNGGGGEAATVVAAAPRANIMLRRFIDFLRITGAATTQTG
jgi:hypothetical protein